MKAYNPSGRKFGEGYPDWDPLRRSTLRQIVSRVSPARLRGSSINAIWGALAEGGRVVGVLPRFMYDLKWGHRGLSEMLIVNDLHERKRLMFEHSDAFVALPGGVGTLEELVEQMTWQQLGRHTKPVLLANIDGFWEPLIALLAHMRETEFIRPALDIDILKAERVEDIVPRLRAAAARAPAGAKEMAPELARKL